jgi:peptidoglycan/LPS O-acetylase OafA/YrhL
MAIALGWAAGIFFLVRQWALNEQWHDVHRWALCLGALLVCMSGGFLGSSSWPRSDVVAKVVLNLIAVACMVGLAMRIKQRSAIARSAT